MELNSHSARILARSQAIFLPAATLVGGSTAITLDGELGAGEGGVGAVGGVTTLIVAGLAVPSDTSVTTGAGAAGGAAAGGVAAGGVAAGGSAAGDSGAAAGGPGAAGGSGAAGGGDAGGDGGAGEGSCAGSDMAETKEL